jgi:hypothetical protein
VGVEIRYRARALKCADHQAGVFEPTLRIRAGSRAHPLEHIEEGAVPRAGDGPDDVGELLLAAERIENWYCRKPLLPYALGLQGARCRTPAQLGNLAAACRLQP